MSEQPIIRPQLQEQFSDILLVLDKRENKIKAVKGLGANNELETVSPEKKNQTQFMRVDKHGNLFSNFVYFFSCIINQSCIFGTI